MNKFLKNLFLFLFFFIIILIIFKFLIINKINIEDSLDFKNLKGYKNTFQAIKLIKEASNKSLFIKSLESSNILIRTKRSFAKGSLCYEGDNIRLIVNSFLGKEIDIGSNSSIFWFWSKRIRPQALYYSNHNDSPNNRLRPVFNKQWVFDCFFFNKFNIDNYKKLDFFLLNNSLVVKEKRKVSETDHVFIFTTIDLKDLIVTSKHMYDLEDNALAAVNYQNFDDNYLPRLVTINWYEENIYMEWEIKEFIINEPIDSNNWNPPNYNLKINISN